MRPAQFLLRDLKDTIPMADEEGVLTNLDNTGDAKPNGADTQPAIGLLTQYVKDLSVENPNAPDVFQWTEAPQIDIQFNIGADPVSPEVHEVVLKLTITAASQRGKAYIAAVVKSLKDSLARGAGPSAQDRGGRERFLEGTRATEGAYRRSWR